MCSFLVTNRKVEDIDSVNYYLKFRGPDHTEIVREKEWTFIHNLLAITGKFTVQPLQKDGIFLVFNGEIYNFQDYEETYDSDGYFIIDQYIKHQDDFIKKLDGEFALVLVDFNKKILYFSGDLFGTKPLYVAKEKDEIGLSSYKSALDELGFNDIVRVSANKYYRLDLTDFSIKYKTIYTWNLDQWKDSYEHWEEAFHNSLSKRLQFTKNKILVPLSSGYDSGALVCGLTKLMNTTDFITYSFYGNEDADIIKRRLSNEIFYLKSSISSSEKDEILKMMHERVEPFYYGPTPEQKTHNGFDDKGAIGLFGLLNEMKQTHDVKIQLSGQGGDEITGNIPTYGFNTKNPNPWPNKLESVFPWGNFYLGANWSYLNKEECIAGSLGIETRYPLLDKFVVQEFINLSASLKNKNYKAPITALFDKYNFPYKKEKLGFNLQII